MEHSSSYTAGFFVGFGAVILLALLVILAKRKLRGPSSKQYDERQRAAQGKAYQWAYYTLLSYTLAAGLFDLSTGIVWADRYMEMMLGVFLSVGVFAAICIRHDAYVGFRDQPKKYILLFVVLGLINIIPSVLTITQGIGFVENGILTHRAANPIAGLLLISLALILAVQAGRAKRRLD